MNYVARNQLIARMGFPKYEDYLASPLWKSIRARVYAEKGRTCLRCELARATQIHHTSYDETTMRGEVLDCLIPICEDCQTRASNEHDKHKARELGISVRNYRRQVRLVELCRAM